MGGEGLDVYWQSDPQTILVDAFDFGGKYGMILTRFAAISEFPLLDLFMPGAISDAYKPTESLSRHLMIDAQLSLIPEYLLLLTS